MHVIRPNCRTRFKPCDMEFLAKTLTNEGGKTESLIKLSSDEQSLDILLDDKRLLRALLDMRGCLVVSLSFYFYVLVRHTLLRSGIDNREAADYVASLLEEFSALRHMRRQGAGNHGALDYMCDMLTYISNSDGEQRFVLQAHVGNYALFLAGLFPRSVAFRELRKAAPGFRYYEELGSAHFRTAGDHELAHRYSISSVLQFLAHAFHDTRLALNGMAEEMFFLKEESEVERLLSEVSGVGGVDFAPDGPPRA